MAPSHRLQFVTQRKELLNLSRTVQLLIGPKLTLVEELIAKNLRSPYTPGAEMGAYLAESRGKRLRPTILLLISSMLGYEGDKDCTYAAIFEFIHTATLIHDDIVDQALLRRGHASLTSQWGPELSVLMGDKVFLTAMDLAINQGPGPILPLISRTALSLIQGELVQSCRKWDLTMSRKDNLDIISHKTADLFAACAETPGHLAKLSPPSIDALRTFGSNLGVSFQLIDDCLDYASNEETLGKPTGNDLKEGKITLPLILYLEGGTSEDRAFIEAVVASRRFDPHTLQEVTARIVHSGALEGARDIAASYAEDARKMLKAFPDNRFKASLNLMPDYILRRRF